MKTLKRTWAEVSLDNLEHNYRAIKNHIPEGCRFLGVMKADAYGHGAVPLSHALCELGAEYLAVSNLEEAIQLRRGGVRAPMLILGYTPASFADTMVFMDITQEVHSLEYAKELDTALAGTNYILNVHLKLDTGMTRIGFFAYDHERTLPELLEVCPRVAVIDHHRRAATYIEGAALNYHEPYASSACELVTELLQCIMEPADLLRAEAEALLAGIVLDTKNFTMRTGGRTFEAAAFLRRSGADTAEVKKLFQNDLEDTIAKYSIIQHAHLYREHIAVAVAEKAVGRVIIAQAADELLNIIGIDASFVLAPDGDRVIISGRSMGEVNVQVILETLGGGGNAAAAGGQVQGKPIQEVAKELAQAIDKYLEE